MTKIKVKSPFGFVATINKNEYETLYKPRGWVIVGSSNKTTTSKRTPKTTTRNRNNNSNARKSTTNSTITIYYRNGSTMKIPRGDLSYWQRQGWSTTKPQKTTIQKTTNIQRSQKTNIQRNQKTNKTQSNVLNDVFNDPRVKNDKGVNGVTMADWLRGNASLFPKLAQLGYTKDDLINEAYAQTRYNKSAFTGDMTVVPRNQNKPRNFSKPKTKDTSAQQTTQPTDSSGLTPEQKKALQDLNNYIDSLDLGIAEKAILKQIAGMDFTSGQKVPTNEELAKIIEDAARNAEQDIAPYYQVLTQREIEDLRNKMADIRNEAARYAQQEKLNYEQRLAQTKKNLRAAGLTFSGTSKKLLGTEGFIKADGYEGILQKERRYNLEDARARWQEQARDIGTKEERLLGSTKMPKFTGLPDPYKGTTTYQWGRTSPLYLPHQKGAPGYVPTGDIELRKKKDIETSKWNRIAKYRINI